MPTPSRMNDWKPRPTKCREVDGSWMTYQGWWNGGGWTRHAFRAPHSPRKYQRPPVRGGRWRIRRLPPGVRSNSSRPWFAWTDGKAKRYNRSFEKYEHAFAWAQFVAETYRAHDDAQAMKIIGAAYEYPGKGEDREFL